MMAILEARAVSKTYRTRGVETQALVGVDLAIEEGEFSALAGPSGSGKTTLLNVLGALDEPTSGEVTLDGQLLSDLSPAQLADLRLHKLGFVFQAYNLIPVFTARENVDFVMQLQGASAKERRSRTDELLRDVGLADLADKRPLEMSGGQQQRVAVARAIATRPRIVLADEPTANLDSSNARQLLDLMERLNRERGITYLFSTHDPRVMEKARRVIQMCDGRIESDLRKPDA